MSNNVIPVDFRGQSAFSDCLNCLVTFAVAVDEARKAGESTNIPAAMVELTQEAYRRLVESDGDVEMLGALAIDCLYQHISTLTRLDAVTQAYAATVVRHFFDLIKPRTGPLLYILDNSLRQDRYDAAIELFNLAGIQTVSPRSDGKDWPTLDAGIRSKINQGTHVAYIEPDAAVNHIAQALALARSLKCIVTFRNLAPQDPKLEIVRMRRSTEPR